MIISNETIFNLFLLVVYLYIIFILLCYFLSLRLIMN